MIKRLIMIAGILWMYALPAVAGDGTFPLKFSQGHRIWNFEPTWLTNSTSRPLQAVNSGFFGVDEANHGAKWTFSTEAVDPAQTPFLIVRYAASPTLAVKEPTGYDAYFLFGFDFAHAMGGLSIVNAGDLSRDGNWHTLAIDLRTIGLQALYKLALEVQATEAPAYIVVDYIDVAAAPPLGAEQR